MKSKGSVTTDQHDKEKEFIPYQFKFYSKTS